MYYRSSKTDAAMQKRFEERGGGVRVRVPMGHKPRKHRPKPASTGKYRIIFVLSGGQTVVAHQERAPDARTMISLGQHKNAKFVIRYWPSRNAWRVLDIRNAQLVTSATNHRWWKAIGHDFLNTMFPSEDAAVMAAFALS